MQNRTDLNLGDVFCRSIIYHMPDYWLDFLTGYDFYFRWNHQFAEVNKNFPELAGEKKPQGF